MLSLKGFLCFVDLGLGNLVVLCKAQERTLNTEKHNFVFLIIVAETIVGEAVAFVWITKEGVFSTQDGGLWSHGFLYEFGTENDSCLERGYAFGW